MSEKVENKDNEETKNDKARFEEEFKLPPRYEIIKPLGSGAYGLVVSAKDTKKDINIFEYFKKNYKKFCHFINNYY